MGEHVDWGHDSFAGGAEMAKSAEVCRPDYEKLIAQKRASLNATRNMFDAIKHYIFHYHHGNRQSPLKDLLGHLLIEGDQLEEAIAILVDQQEKDNTKD